MSKSDKRSSKLDRDEKGLRRREVSGEFKTRDSLSGKASVHKTKDAAMDAALAGKVHSKRQTTSGTAWVLTLGGKELLVDDAVVQDANRVDELQKQLFEKHFAKYMVEVAEERVDAGMWGFICDQIRFLNDSVVDARAAIAEALTTEAK